MSWEAAKPKEKPACPKCGNRLRVRADQVGMQVKCPKCNHQFTLGQPEKKAAPASPDDEYEPEIPLKPATIVHEDYRPLGEDPDAPAPEIMPMAPPDTSYLPHYEADWATDELEVEAPHARPPSEEPDYLELARRRGLVRTTDTRFHPSSLYFSHVFTFPWQAGNATRWAVMSAGLTACGLLLAFLLQQFAAGVSLGMLVMPIASLVGSALLLVTLSACSACFLAAVDDTADGHDRVQEDTLPPLDQWYFSFFSLLWIWLISGALGYPLAFVPALGPAVIPIASIIVFPILTLSAMECGSFAMPLSPKVWGTLVRYPLAWLGFYLISSLVLAAWYVSTAMAVPDAPYLVVLVAAPALAAVMLIYARLLGRLGWRISGEKIRTAPKRVRRAEPPIQDAPQVDLSHKQPEPEPEASPTKDKKRRRYKKIEIPDDLDAPGTSGHASPSAPPPRLDFHRRP